MAAEKLREVVQKLKEMKGRRSRWFFIKKPWEITGPCSDEAYVDPLPNAKEYRVFAPATPPVRPCIPNAEADRVFNIVYYTRDRRRAPRDRVSYVLTKQQLEEEMQQGKELDMTKFVGSGSHPFWMKVVVDPARENGYQK